MQIPKHTLGIGDRFGHQGVAQLRAFLAARDEGIEVHPVWNKSNREHTLIGSHPADVRIEADVAVKNLDWQAPYFVDADHIGLKTVDRFIPTSDFFTIDVAEFVGKAPDREICDAFLKFMTPWIGHLEIPGINRKFELTREVLSAASAKFLSAMQEAGRIYRRIAEQKGSAMFITEVSIDETDRPQTPLELFLILAMIAHEKIPAQTIAPKFTGRFNKGIDYSGDLDQFALEFDEDLCVIAFAISRFGLPQTLKLSVHSGSDKFSLYPLIQKIIREHDAGLHLKTAGTTWLEEVIGLAESGGEGLVLAQEIYAEALLHFDELTGPYATVIDIDCRRLPPAQEVERWSSEKFTQTLRHAPHCEEYNPHFRQLLHVAFKLAAKLGARYTEALDFHREIIGRNVTENLLERHIRPVFGGKET